MRIPLLQNDSTRKGIRFMAINDEGASLARLLTVLTHEEELIIKPFHSGRMMTAGGMKSIFLVSIDSAHSVRAIESGKIVSRLNKPLFDYQIGKYSSTDFKIDRH